MLLSVGELPLVTIVSCALDAAETAAALAAIATVCKQLSRVAALAVVARLEAQLEEDKLMVYRSRTTFQGRWLAGKSLFFRGVGSQVIARPLGLSAELVLGRARASESKLFGGGFVLASMLDEVVAEMGECREPEGDDEAEWEALFERRGDFYDDWKFWLQLRVADLAPFDFHARIPAALLGSTIWAFQRSGRRTHVRTIVRETAGADDAAFVPLPASFEHCTAEHRLKLQVARQLAPRFAETNALESGCFPLYGEGLMSVDESGDAWLERRLARFTRDWDEFADAHVALLGLASATRPFDLFVTCCTDEEDCGRVFMLTTLLKL